MDRVWASAMDRVRDWSRLTKCSPAARSGRSTRSSIAVHCEKMHALATGAGGSGLPGLAGGAGRKGGGSGAASVAWRSDMSASILEELRQWRSRSTAKREARGTVIRSWAGLGLGLGL